MNIDTAITPEYIIIGILTIITIGLIVWIVRIEKKLKILLITKDAKTLDDTLKAVNENLTTLNRFHQDTKQHLGNLEQRMKRTISGVDTVRFNPFAGDGSGGNHSFATAFLSEKGDGVVISSMYTRERTNVFSKQLENFQAKQGLTEEEGDVVERVKQSL